MVANVVMTQFFLRAELAIALKTPPGQDFGDFARPYGSGFNAELEAGWTSTNELALAVESVFSDLVKKIDHRHLGMDAPELGITTPESMLQFCFHFLERTGHRPDVLRLRRGENIFYEMTSQLPQ